MTNSVIMELIDEHEKMRNEGLNLIASENWLAPAVRKALASDLAGRYHSTWYGGTSYIRKIIEETETLAKRLFRARYAFVLPLSGTMCDLATLFTMSKPGEKVGIMPFTHGGFPFGIEQYGRKRVHLPVNEANNAIDAEKAKPLIRSENIALTYIGASFILFPHPVRELTGYARENALKSRFVYDGAHVMGLIATGEFQDPLREGAEVLFGSTHKSLYGPQGGIILTNNTELVEPFRDYLDGEVRSGICLVDNPHMNRVAALGMALEELSKDRGYGTRVIKNAKTLGRALDDKGIPVRFSDRGYTESHQILLKLDAKRAAELCHRYDKVGIFTDEGGRLGTAELTHRGMVESDMEEIADIMASVYKHGARDESKKRVRKLAKGFSQQAGP